MGVIQPSLRDLDCCSTIPPLKGWAILEPPSGRVHSEASSGSDLSAEKCLKSSGRRSRSQFPVNPIYENQPQPILPPLRCVKKAICCQNHLRNEPAPAAAAL